MVTIYIDGKKYCVSGSHNLLEVCLSFGFDIPYFCWHPILGSVGSCRQCAVKEYSGVSDSNGRIVMSCMTPVVDGLIVSVNEAEVNEFRKSVLELLMANHPHDCPVCSEGGHCHLQDITVMTGHYMRRYRFKKRTHINQYLGPFISHEMNRCISCYRCVRYYRDYADGHDLGVYGVHDNLYFGRFQEGQLESEFSGNLIEVCPTGVFTDKTFSQHYARKWDVQYSPSVCVHCSVGCNIILGERYGKICRVENRYNVNINGYFLCDRGRFGYDYVNNINNRFKCPLKKIDKKNWIELSEEQILTTVGTVLRDSTKVIGIGSSRASIESNFALRKLVGVENFFIGINRSEHQILLLVVHILKNSGISIASVKDIEAADAILLLGEDITQTSARIALAVRQAVKGGAVNLAKGKDIPVWHRNAVNSLGKIRNPLFITSIDRTRLDDIATWTYYSSLDNQACFGFVVANILDNTAPVVSHFNDDLINQANTVAQALLQAKNPVIISGSNMGSEAIISAAANVAKSLKNCGKNVSISLVVSDANSVGLAMMGGGNLDDVLEIEDTTTIDSLIVLETDLYRHISFKNIDDFLKRVNCLIVLDHQRLSFHKHADFIFSSASISESDGTLINQEGRAQRCFRVYSPSYYDSSLLILESWRWLYKLYIVLHSQDSIFHLTFDNVVNDIVLSLPELFYIHLASPNALFRIGGQKLARAPNRYSGRTSMHTIHIGIHEPRVLQDVDSMFTFSMEGNNSPSPIRQHIAFVWSPGWNSSQAWNKFYSEVENNLCSKDSGVRLFDATNIQNRNIDWFTKIPMFSSSFNDITVGNRWYIVPYWHIFGSEELSQLSLTIQKCITKPYVVLNRLDAVQCDLYDKNILVIRCNGHELSLPLIFSDNLASGYIGLPVGLPNISLFYLGMCITSIEGMY